MFVLSHSFVPERKVELDNEKLPFKEWEHEGLLTIVKGDYVTKEAVYGGLLNNRNSTPYASSPTTRHKPFGWCRTLSPTVARTGCNP